MGADLGSVSGRSPPEGAGKQRLALGASPPSRSRGLQEEVNQIGEVSHQAEHERGFTAPGWSSAMTALLPAAAAPF